MRPKRQNATRRTNDQIRSRVANENDDVTASFSDDLGGAHSDASSGPRHAERARGPFSLLGVMIIALQALVAQASAAYDEQLAHKPR